MYDATWSEQCSTIFPFSLNHGLDGVMRSRLHLHVAAVIPEATSNRLMLMAPRHRGGSG